MNENELKFRISELRVYGKGPYSSTRYLDKAICYNKDKVIAVSEGIQFEPDSNEKGGIIVFSVEVNAEKMDNNKFINWFKQKFATVKNKLLKNRKIDDIANKHELVGWTIGNFLKGRYTAKNGKTYSEDSLSVEIIGVSFDELVEIAEELCVEFLQESVLVKDYSSGRIVFVDAE